MKAIYSFTILMLMVFTLSSFTEVTDEEILSQGITSEQLNQLKTDEISGSTGTVQFSECHSSINVPAGFVFLNKENSKKLLCDYWNNPESHITNLLGCLVPSTSKYFYQIPVAYVITYDNCGYVKDDDANSVDYDELLTQIKESTKEDNKNLPAEQQCTIKGWAVQPKYMAGSHTLVWAKTLDINGVETVNYDMRILGKDGLVSINAVISPEDCQEVIAKESNIINSLQFDKGYGYTDFDPSRDHTSEWTIGGLVAGSILAKSGFFAKLGLLLLKGWKLIAVGIFGIGTAIVKWFKGKKDSEE